MTLRAVLLMSSQAGGGRSTLASNLAWLLGQKGPCWLLERVPAELSELALQLGEAPLPQEEALNRRAAGMHHTCVGDVHGLERALQGLRERDGWALVDGSTLADPDWQATLSICGAVLWTERGDIQGCRRLQQGRRALAAAHLPLSAVRGVWMGTSEALPLPDMPGLHAVTVPTDPRAWERSARASLAVQEEPQSSFSRAIQRLAQDLPSPAPSTPVPSIRAPAESGPAPDPMDALLRQLGDSLRRDLAKFDAPSADPAQREGRLRAEAEQRIAQVEDPWLDAPRRAQLLKRLLQDMLGLGPLEDLLGDDGISEVMVNRHDQVYVERQGRLSPVAVSFRDEAHLRSVIERIVWPLGRRIDESSPKVDARLPDGSRVNAVIPPLAIKGSSLTIRKFPKHRLDMAELEARGALSPACAAFLRQAVLRRRNILVSGGTGSGKTTLLNALSSSIPDGERIVTIEDSAELKLQQAHVVTLESRPPNLEGQGAVSIRDLVGNALRMRPDRIVVGECRGGEALDMLQAMNTGHDGSLTTLHANSPRDALHRLETLCLMAGLELPLRVIRQQIAGAIDLVLQVGRLRDGSRRVLAVAELCGMEGEVLSTQDLFVYRPAPGGGALRATGIAARFYQELKEDGEAMDFGVFKES